MRLVPFQLLFSLWLSPLVTGQNYNSGYMAQNGERPFNRARVDHSEGDSATHGAHRDSRHFDGHKGSSPTYEDRGQSGAEADHRRSPPTGVSNRDAEGEGWYYQSGSYRRVRPGHRQPTTTATTISPVIADETEAALIKDIEIALGLTNSTPDYTGLRVSVMVLTEQCRRLFASGSLRLQQFCMMLNSGR